MFELLRSAIKTKTQTKLVTYYGIFAFLTIAIVTYFSYYQAAQTLQASLEDKLQSIGRLKQDNINQWVDEQQRLVIFLSNLPELRTLAGQMLNDQLAYTERNEAQRQLTELILLIVQRTSDFIDIEILNMDGDIIVSASKNNIGISQADQPYFIEGKTKTFTQNFYQSDLLNSTTITISTPLFDNRERRVGVFVVHLSMNRVDRILHDDNGSADSVHSYLFTQDNQIITNDPLVRNQHTEYHSQGIDLAIKEATGTGIYFNHDGDQVIGAYFWMQEQNVALVVEVNRASALAPARALSVKVALFGLFTSLALILVVFLLARQITYPLEKLTETAIRIEAGELDAAAPLLSTDEVGDLAQAFNNMTEKLRKTLAGLESELIERTRTQHELLKFRNMMDESSDAIFLIDPETSSYLDFNRIAYESLGYTSEELKQLGVVDIAEHITSLEVWHERIQMVIEQNGLTFETLYRRKDGSTFPVEVSARMLEQVEGSILIAQVRDITARKKDEELLRLNQSRLQAFFNQSLDGFFFLIFDSPQEWENAPDKEKTLNFIFNEQTFTDVNNAMLDQYGITREEFLSRTSRDFFAHDPEQGLRLRRELFNKGRLQLETYERKIDGTPVWFEGDYVCLYDEQKRITGFFGIQRDITERKNILNALKASETKFRLLAENIPSMVYQCKNDSLFTFVYLNAAVESLTGYPRESFIHGGLSFFDLYHPEDLANIIIPEEQKNTNKDAFHLTYRILHKSGEWRWVTEWGAYIVSEADETEYIVGMISDMTEQKQAEAEREEFIRQLTLKNMESETLRESFGSIIGTFDFLEITQKILDQIGKVIPYDSASVWKVDGKLQTAITGRNLPPGFFAANISHMIDEENSAYKIITGEVPYILSNNVQEELLDFKGPFDTQVNSWLAIPLKARGSIIGIIALDGFQMGQFTEDHARLAVAFSNQVAIALENSQLFTELQNELVEREGFIQKLEAKNAETEALRESLATIAGTLEFSEIIQHILNQIKRVVPYDSASVWKVEEDRQIFIGGRNLPPEFSDGMVFLTDETNSARPILIGDVAYILSNDVQTYFPEFQEPPHNYIHSWLSIPLKIKGRIIGLISLDGKQKNQFTERHVELAMTYAGQVAIALENSLLFTDLQHQLEMRKSLIAELESKNAELERFTYTVSHDLKSPLVTINGFLGYLEKDSISGNMDRLRNDIRRIQEAVNKMHRLLSELLELSRIGRMMNEPQTVPFEELVHEAINIVHGQIEERGVTLHVQPGMPAVYGDKPRLVEVLQNLIDNAVKYMGDQASPMIEIGQRGEENGNPVFYVKDNGIGIAPEYHTRIFGLFDKLNPTSEGTGVGLALVKRIIEVHGGRIWVESESGKGAAFLFTLRKEAQ